MGKKKKDDEEDKEEYNVLEVSNEDDDDGGVHLHNSKRSKIDTTPPPSSSSSLLSSNAIMVSAKSDQPGEDVLRAMLSAGTITDRTNEQCAFILNHLDSVYTLERFECLSGSIRNDLCLIIVIITILFTQRQKILYFT
jgi:hypothetical protein